MNDKIVEIRIMECSLGLDNYTIAIWSNNYSMTTHYHVLLYALSIVLVYLENLSDPATIGVAMNPLERREF